MRTFDGVMLVFTGVSMHADRPRSLGDPLTDTHFAVSSDRLESRFIGISSFYHLLSKLRVKALFTVVLNFGMLDLAVQQNVLLAVLPHGRVGHSASSWLHLFSFFRYVLNDLFRILFV